MTYMCFGIYVDTNTQYLIEMNLFYVQQSKGICRHLVLRKMAEGNLFGVMKLNYPAFAKGRKYENILYLLD